MNYITDSRGLSFTVNPRPFGVGYVAYMVWHGERLIARAVVDTRRARCMELLIYSAEDHGHGIDSAVCQFIEAQIGAALVPARSDRQQNTWKGLNRRRASAGRRAQATNVAE